MMPAGDVYGGGSPTGNVFYENGALGDAWAGTFFAADAGRNEVFSYKPARSGAGFALVAVAGLGSVGTQILVNGYVATFYPDNLLATALGWSLGVGRTGAIAGPILGGLVAASALGYQWNFYLFAVVAAIGLLLIASVPVARARQSAVDTHTAAAER